MIDHENPGAINDNGRGVEVTQTNIYLTSSTIGLYIDLTTPRLFAGWAA
jgi:hypothetical protein